MQYQNLAVERIEGVLRVVLNRVGSDFTEGDISLEKAEETINRPIYWQIPNDFKALIGSRNVG